MRLPPTTKRKLAKSFVLILLLAADRTIAAADIYIGKVIYVTDGDTLTILVDDGATKTDYKIRLRHIDAPERKQPWGAKATDTLKKLVAGRVITATCHSKHWQRHVCDVVRDDGLDVQREMVAQGAAWVSYKYNARDDLWSVQRDAKDARRGERHRQWIPPRSIRQFQFALPRGQIIGKDRGDMLPTRRL